MEVNPTPLTQELDRLFREVWLVFMYVCMYMVVLPAYMSTGAQFFLFFLQD